MLDVLSDDQCETGIEIYYLDEGIGQQMDLTKEIYSKCLNFSRIDLMVL
jgi:hypothetical protein